MLIMLNILTTIKPEQQYVVSRWSPKSEKSQITPEKVSKFVARHFDKKVAMGSWKVAQLATLRALTGREKKLYIFKVNVDALLHCKPPANTF